MKVLLSVVCATLLATSVQGCGFLDLKCKAKEAIEEAGSQLIGQAKLAFEQAMDHVFDQDISPLLDKVEAAIDAGIDKVDQDVNETINHIESAVETIIHDAAQTANALATNITHDIEQIISKAASAIEEVENKFYQDASNLLEKINQIVEKGQCLDAAFVKQIQDGIYRLLKSLNPYYRLSSCWRSLGFKVTMTLEDLTTIQLYNYQKECTLLDKITPTTPVKGPGGILETYAQGQLYAAEYYCIGETANAPAFQDVMTKEWLWWGVQYNVWRNIGMPEVKNNQHMIDEKLAVKDDPTCNTAEDCYAQAMEALKEVEQTTLPLETGLSTLNQSMIEFHKEIEANISANRQAISANMNTSETNKNSVTTLNSDVTRNSQNPADSIAVNKNAISKFRVNSCNCKTFNPVITTCSSTTLANRVVVNIVFLDIAECCELCGSTGQ